MTLRGLLKIAMVTLGAVWLIATCLGHAGAGDHWFLVSSYFLAVSVPVGLWFLKVDATDGPLSIR